MRAMRWPILVASPAVVAFGLVPAARGAGPSCDTPGNFFAGAWSAGGGAYSHTQNLMRMVLNGDIKDRTDFDPLVVWFTPFVSELFGETWHAESDVPGTASDRVRFGEVKEMRWNGTWVGDDDLWLPQPDVWRYHAAWVNRPGRFEIWTHPI